MREEYTLDWSQSNVFLVHHDVGLEVSLALPIISCYLKL